MSPAPLNLLAAERWDVLIAGAGPAGGVAAVLLARMGLRVLLADAARFPRAKVCGGCLSAAGARVLRELGLGDLVDEPNAVRLSEMRLGVGTREAVIRLPVGGVVVCREWFDSKLAAHAVSAGATLIDGAALRVDGPRLPGASTLSATLTRAGESVRLAAAAFVAADGLSASSVSHLATLRPRTWSGSRVGIGALVELGRCLPPSGVLRMMVGHGVYAGAVRVADGRCDIAASIAPEFMKASGGPRRALAPLLSRFGIETNDDDGVVWKGTPRLTRTRSAAIPGIFLLGDAAAYAEPMTGEGMTWALTSAREAAGIIAASIGREALESAATWRAAHRRLLDARLRSCRAVAALVRAPTLVTAAVMAGTAAPALASWIAGRFARPLPRALAGITP
ncbi:MAG: NAD(P)/FAD-dependent oxidoreductase [Phycisphaerales bacterium]